jgi:serine kinase of HPr protein (carbohydrate metabolism regulator)
MVNTSIHASAVLIGPRAALIRGPSGSGKSLLAWELLQACAQGTALGALLFARLVADDRAHIEARAGRLLVRPAQALAGLIEIHGLGIRRLPFEPVAAVGLVIDLAAPDAVRLPDPAAGQTTIEGVALPRLAVAAGLPAMGLLLAFLQTSPAAD